MQATPSSKMAFYTLSAANAMNNTKALHLAPVPDSMLIGEVGSCSVWPTTGQGARGPPTGSCFLLLSVDSFRCRQPVYPYMKKRRSYDYMSRGTLAVAELDLLYGEPGCLVQCQHMHQRPPERQQCPNDTGVPSPPKAHDGPRWPAYDIVIGDSCKLCGCNPSMLVGE